MTVGRFKEIETRSGEDKMQLCYTIFTEEKGNTLSYPEFQNFFSIWLRMFRRESIDGVIEWFKNNKVK